MTKEELDTMGNEAWEQFRRDYPMLTNDAWYSRVIMAAFGGKGIIRLIWENAWLKGINMGVDLIRRQKKEERQNG